HAVVVRALLAPGDYGQSAGLLGVALQAAASVIGHSLSGRRLPVRVVAGGTAQPAGAGLETAALVHPLDQPHHLALGRPFRAWDEDRPEQVQRQPRTEVEGSATLADQALLSLEVALLADPFAQHGGEVSRVDDRDIGRPWDRISAFASLDV